MKKFYLSLTALLFLAVSLVYFLNIDHEKDQADKIIIYSAGSVKNLPASDKRYSAIKREIESLARETNNKYLPDDGKEDFFKSELFQKSREQDYAIELVYYSPQKISIGYDDPIKNEKIKNIFIAFTNDILPLNGVCFSEKTCLQTSGGNNLLKLIDKTTENFLPGIRLEPLRESHIAGRVPYAECQYDEYLIAVCGLLDVSFSEDITSEEFNKIASLVSESRGRVISTSLDLLSFTIEFVDDKDLVDFKNKISSMSGVLGANYRLVPSLDVAL
jgi:hypothetical protein